MTPNLEPAIEAIVQSLRRVPTERAALFALSGIDASGKGYLTAKLAQSLSASGFHVANINIDGWLNLPQVRFSDANPAEHFYHNAIRFDAMFEQLILPLQRPRAIDIEMDFAEETASHFRKRQVIFDNIDIILLEGINLLKREFQSRYDSSIWIDCSFETALERAIGRAQEGLPPEATVKAYRTIYFPAQEIHFWRDSPQSAAAMESCTSGKAGGLNCEPLKAVWPDYAGMLVTRTSLVDRAGGLLSPVP